MPDKFILDIHLSKLYKFEVEVLHLSNQVIRFSVKCSSQEMILEKRLLEKRQQWKILSSNVKFDTSDSKRNFSIICQYIDNEIKEARKPYVHPKNAT